MSICCLRPPLHPNLFSSARPPQPKRQPRKLSGGALQNAGASALALAVAVLLLASIGLAEGEATHGFIASVHPVATEAGLNVLKTGGNAVDAAVAVALTLGVVDGDNSGIGGGCFMLIRRANGSLIALDGRETAPAAASR